MNRFFIFFILFTVQCGCNMPAANTTMEPVTAAAIDYTKADLLKIKWIEGKWKGMDEDEAFYEIYAFVNDSTIKTISYEWNGKDSSKSYTDYLTWKDGLYYLGEKKDWAVTSISDSLIMMLPNSSKIHNNITWKTRDAKGWDAVLVAPKGTKEYHMEKFDPFLK